MSDSRTSCLLKNCGTTLRVVNDIVDSRTFRSDCDAERRTTLLFNRLVATLSGRTDVTTTDITGGSVSSSEPLLRATNQNLQRQQY